MEVEPNKLEENWRNPDGTWKAGHPSNGGRPRGKTLKEWRREKLMEMSEEERLEFLKAIPNLDQWKMAEGLPDSKTETTGQLQVLLLDKDLAEQYGIRITPESENSSQEPKQV